MANILTMKPLTSQPSCDSPFAGCFNFRRPIKFLFLLIGIVSFLQSCASPTSVSVSVSPAPSSTAEALPIKIEERLGNSIPPGSKVNQNQSLVFDPGDDWYGRVVITALKGDDKNRPPYEFFLEQYPKQGWTLSSATRGTTSMLVFVKKDRVVTIEISDRNMSLGWVTAVLTMQIPRAYSTPSTGQKYDTDKLQREPAKQREQEEKPKTAETQRLENERQAAQLQEEKVRVTRERERLDAEKLQRQQAQQREQEEKLKTAEIQRVEAERKAAKLEEERIRIAKEREQFEADKLQREQAQKREQEEKLKLAQQETLAVQSGKRIALVMGNSKYIHRPLKNPINDADDISKALKSANFEVIDIREASLPQMRTAVRQFGDRLLQNDVGLVYYSGHGVEVKGKNYFIPVNADIQREDEIVDQSLDVSLILEKMTTAGKGVNILIVDACRDDPFGRSFRSTSQGLATMDAPTGTIIAYATSPGRVASDGDGRNSPYTKALVKAMQTPNKPIEQVFKEVRRSVREETKNQQTPWENTSLSGDFYFRVQK